MVGGIGFGAASALGCALLTDSSEGRDRLYNVPSMAPHEWFGEAATMGLALAFSLIPGWALGKLALHLGIGQPEIGTMLGFFFCFPIVLLSALEQGSPFGVISVRILSSLIRRPGLWFLFYLTTAFEAACFLGLVWIGSIGFQLVGELAVACIVASAVGVALIYLRVLGRFAWWLAESLPEESEETESE